MTTKWKKEHVIQSSLAHLPNFDTSSYYQWMMEGFVKLDNQMAIYFNFHIMFNVNQQY